MGLESTMICLDNSEWMRNGDYVPTRMEAQHDAANLLCGAKTQANPESTVGVLSMAGKRVELLVSPTDDMGKILNALHHIPIGGECRFVNSIQVAQLALKHRREKKGSQRVIVFVASPITDDDKSITKIGKLLKKNNVAVDVVSFGDAEVNQSKLQILVDAASSNNNSHFVTVPAGILPSDVLVSSPIIHGGEGGAAAAAAGGAAGGGGFAEYGGIDPSMDPELALALRVSMEEERARQEASSKASSGEAGESAASSSSTPAVASSEPGKKDEDSELLSKALAMSMDQSGGGSSGETEDEAMQRALQMSMQEEKTSAAQTDSKDAPPPPAPASGAAAGASAAAFLDPSFVNSLLNGLPGVDPNDPKIKAAMAQIAQSQPKNDDKKEDKDDSKKK